MSDQSIVQKNPFGLNITLPQKTIEEVAKVAKQEFENITISPLEDYLDENDKVFSGEVANEIKKYQAQIYSLGQVMREDQTTRTFNRKM